MSVSGALDVVIGLVLMYLLLSLICTITNEFIASVLKLRASNLRRGIEELVDNENFRTTLAKTSLIAAANRISGWRGSSYLQPRTFALGLLEAIKRESDVSKLESVQDVIGAIQKLPPSNVRESLLAIATSTVKDVEEFRRHVGTWFDDMMDRASGVYKRNLQYLSFAAGLALAVAVNADTIAVSRALWADATLRAQLVQSAEQLVSRTSSTEELMDLASIQAELRPLPIGWDFEAPYFSTDWYASVQGILLKIAGLLLTAAAVSLGAPFWFDVLSKFTKLRASGSLPKKEDQPKKKEKV
jgi:hypothetical protein